MVVSNVRRDVCTSDGGLGLVEVVVSMFLFAILAMAALPVLVNGLRVSAFNRDVATATQLASDDVESARARGDISCASLLGYVVANTQPTNDLARFHVARALTTGSAPVAGGPACPTSVASGLLVTYTVTMSVDGRSAATLTTQILVRS